MSYDYDFQRIQNFSSVLYFPCTKKEYDQLYMSSCSLRPIYVDEHNNHYMAHWWVEAILNHSLYCGFNEITEKNYYEVFFRIKFREKCLGTVFQSKNRNLHILIEHVERMKGLRTNSICSTKTQFLNKIYKTFNKQ